jgi:hypothetical protein
MTEDTKKPNINPNDADIGMGGIDRLNSGNGKTEILRENEIGGRPFTLDDYNKALEDAADEQRKVKNMNEKERERYEKTPHPEPVEQVKRADMINAQNKVQVKNYQKTLVESKLQCDQKPQ